jgi:hypothetical protein
MKKIIILLFILITNIVNAQVIYSDNMEDAGWTWKGIPKVLINSGYVGGLTSNNDSPANSPLYNSLDTCFRLVGIGLGSSSIEKDTILYSNVTGLNPNGYYRISFKLASIGLNPTTNTAAGVDASDYIQIEWSNDGGLTYKPEIKIVGASNATWGFNSLLGAQITKISTGSISSFTSSTSTPINTVNLDLPINTTQLSFRIILSTNATGETWCVDDVNLSLSTVLPIDLLSFNAGIKNNVTILNWVTLSETNNDYFIISKSKDAINYSDISIIDGSGNSNENKVYNYIDEFPYDGLNYYKLSQVDYDGQRKTFYPLCVKYIDKKNKNVKRILNISGQEVDKNYDGIKIYYFDDNTTIISN